MQYFIVKSENVTTYGRTFLKGTKIGMEQIEPDHLPALLDQKAIEPCDEEVEAVPYYKLDAE